MIIILMIIILRIWWSFNVNTESGHSGPRLCRDHSVTSLHASQQIIFGHLSHLVIISCHQYLLHFVIIFGPLSHLVIILCHQYLFHFVISICYILSSYLVLCHILTSYCVISICYILSPMFVIISCHQNQFCHQYSSHLPSVFSQWYFTDIPDSVFHSGISQTVGKSGDLSAFAEVVFFKPVIL